MNSIKYFLFYVSISLLLVGCDGDVFSVVVDADIPEIEDKLVLHSFIQNTDSVIRVGLSNSRGLLEENTQLEQVNDGTVSLYRDGNKLCDFDLGDQSNILNYEFNLGSSFGLRPGTFEIRATAPGFPELSATQTFPDFVPLTAIEYERDAYLSSERRIYDKLEIAFDDQPNIENYYELIVVVVDSTCNSNATIINPLYVESNDIHVHKSASNNSILIADEGIDGQTYELILGVSHGRTNGYDLQISWRSISKEQFLYSTSVFEFSVNQDLGLPGDPIPIFSNVENGVGIFGCAAHKIYRLNEFENFAKQTLTASIDSEENFEACTILSTAAGTNTIIRAVSGDRRFDIRILQQKLGIANAEISFYDRSGSTTLAFANLDAILNITTYDEANGLIAGSFSGVLENFQDGTSIHITDLEFDLNFSNW